MSEPVEFRFRIDAFRPETLPMKRLAEYLLELARLFGETERVHFRAIAKGSTIIAQQVEPEAAPKVRQRLLEAQGSDAPEEIARVREKLNDMLAADNATGELRQKGVRGFVLKFPGRLSAGDVIGPIAQEGAVQGVLVRIGGEDRTAHAHIQDGERTYFCETSRELAKQLSPHLYGPPLRIYGRGRWRRERSGEWRLIDFKAREFEVLDATSLRDLATQLSQVTAGDWADSDDPVGAWRKLRGEA